MVSDEPDLDELNRREVVYPDGVSDSDFDDVEVKCKVCRGRRKTKVVKGGDEDWPKLLKCFECMSETGHVPVS